MILAATKSPVEIALWAGGLIVVVIVLGLVVLALRRAMLSKEGKAAEAGLFESLREMRDTGAISIEEYDAARKKMVTKAAARMGQGTPPDEVKGKTPKRTSKPPQGEVRAKPGYDLTGRPLPKSDNRPGATE